VRDHLPDVERDHPYGYKRESQQDGQLKPIEAATPGGGPRLPLKRHTGQAFGDCDVK
jgi:hypothetical protein